MKRNQLVSGSQRLLTMLLLFALGLFLCRTTADAFMQNQSGKATLDRLIEEKGIDETVSYLETQLKAHDNERQTVLLLQCIIWQDTLVSRDESLRLRWIIGEHTTWPEAQVTPPDEPGEPMVLSGNVTDENGQPVEGALVYIFQTDAKGYYRTERAMDEPASRLFGYARTSATGHYVFHTIRPGGYPQARPGVSGNQRFIPQHIHLIVTAPGFLNYKCKASSCQLVFADDPRMTVEWHEWARKGGHPVLQIRRDDKGVQHCSYDIILSRAP